ncbi:MAG TPA: hypothetical protein HA362_01685 [Nanoarchaeota archaeon]|nr:hypothetical protein [Nanoarchaeota archaeon]
MKKIAFAAIAQPLPCRCSFAHLFAARLENITPNRLHAAPKNGTQQMPRASKDRTNKVDADLFTPCSWLVLDPTLFKAILPPI